MAKEAAEYYNDHTVKTEIKEVRIMDTTIPLYGFGGGGGTGATLTVTAPEGATVTVSKDGKTKRKTAVNQKAVFRGLTSGTWTITITDGTDTASKTVEIRADYEAEITFFTATLQIVYPAGLVCTATDGATVLTAPDTTGSWICTVDSPGTWTVTAGIWSGEAALTETGQQTSLRLARWIVKDGTLTEIGLSNLLISSRSLTPTQEEGYVQIHNTLSNQATGVLSGSKQDLTDVARITADVEVLTVGTSTTAKFNGTALALTTNVKYSSLGNANSAITHEAISQAAGRQTLSLDTSGVTGQWYVGLVLGVSGNCKVYDLRLEV